MSQTRNAFLQLSRTEKIFLEISSIFDFIYYSELILNIIIHKIINPAIYVETYRQFSPYLISLLPLLHGPYYFVKLQ